MSPIQLSIASIGDYPPGSVFGPRTLSDFEFVWMLRGTAVWTCAGRPDLRLGPGDLLLARPGMRDGFTWDPRRPTRHAYAHFSLTPDRDHGGWPLVRRLAHDDPLAGLFRYLVWLDRTAPAGGAARADDVLGLLVDTFVAGPLPGAEDEVPLPPAVDTALAHVRTVWADGPRPVPLPELAAAASVSGVHLSRLFRRRFGVGPVTALDLVRLARAEELLLRSNSSVASVGVACGFADPYHFSRRFRAVYGTSPRAFRAAGPQAAFTSPLVAAGLAPLRALTSSAPIHL